MATVGTQCRGVCCSIIVLGTTALLLSACESKTEAQYIQDAQVQLVAGNVPAAVIDLKNALQKNRGNLEARILLARSEIDQADPTAAQVELATATQDGADPARLAQLRGQADLLSGDPAKALIDATIPKSAAPDLAAGILSARASALIMLGRLDEARDTIDTGLGDTPNSLDLLMVRVQLALAEKNIAQATTYLQTAEMVAPDDYRVVLLKGDAAFVAGDFVAAEAVYASSLKAHSWNLQTRLRLARAQLARQEAKAAQATLAVLLNAAPRNPTVNYLEAIARYQEHDYALALSYSQTSLGAVREYSPAQFIAGASSYALGQLEQASNYLTHVIFADPNNVQARMLLANVQMRLGHPNDAVTTLKPAVNVSAPSARGSDGKPPGTKSKNDAQLLALIGTAAARSGNFGDAAHYYQAAIEKNPADASLREGLGSAEVSNGQTGSGLADLQRAANQNPTAVAPEVVLILGYIRAKDFAKALETAETLAKNRPNDPIGDDLIGLVHALKGENDPAKAAWTKALQLRADDQMALRDLAELAIKEGQFATAVQYYEQLLKANPKDATAAIALAQIELRQGKVAEATSTLQNAIAANPPGADAPREALARLELAQGQAQAALDTVAPVQKANPNNPAALEITGSAQLALGQIEPARNTFQTLAGAAPNAAAPHQLLASAYLAENNATAALRELDAALRIDPKDDAAKLLEVQALAAEGQYPEALKLLAPLEKVYPNTAKVKELKGLIALAENRTDDATAAFTDALKLGDNGADRERLAQAEARAGHVDAAINTLQPWIAAHPTDATAQLTLIGIRLDAQQWDEAVAAARAVAKQQPQNEQLQVNLVRVLLATHRNEEAHGVADQVVKDFPKDAGAHDTAGMTALAQNRPNDAVTEFKSALALADNNIIRDHLADALLKSGDPQDAEGTIRPWTDAHPNDVISRMTLGDIYLATDRPDAARQQYDAVVKLQPNNYLAENNLAWVLMTLHNSKDALAHAQHAASIAPKNAEILDTLGDVLLQNGKARDAVQSLQQATALQPANPEIQFHLAQALANNGDKEQARKILKTLLTAQAQAAVVQFTDRTAAQKLLVELGG